MTNLRVSAFLCMCVFEIVHEVSEAIEVRYIRIQRMLHCSRGIEHKDKIYLLMISSEGANSRAPGGTRYVPYDP